MEKGDFIDSFIYSLSGFIEQEKITELKDRLYAALADYNLVSKDSETAVSCAVEYDNEWYLGRFLAIKSIAGASKKTLAYYRQTIGHMFLTIGKHIKLITTDDMRLYFAHRNIRDNLSKVSQDNERRVFNSFFKTMVEEELLEKNIMVKIPQIKKPKIVKKPFSEYEIELLRKAAEGTGGVKGKRALAIIDTLYSTGCRVGELSGMNRTALEGDKILVTGKGNKQRYVYFNAKALLSVNIYLQTREDDSEALFVETHRPYRRLQVGSIGSIVKNVGTLAGVKNVHCHRFRRTAATIALKRGMPIEQVSLMLGHDELSTTQIYAKSDASEVERAHSLFLGG